MGTLLRGVRDEPCVGTGETDNTAAGWRAGMGMACPACAERVYDAARAEAASSSEVDREDRTDVRDLDRTVVFRLRAAEMPGGATYFPCAAAQSVPVAVSKDCLGVWSMPPLGCSTMARVDARLDRAITSSRPKLSQVTSVLLLARMVPPRGLDRPDPIEFLRS